MHSFIALYVIACLNPTNHNTCVLCRSPTTRKHSLTDPR
jgi:hypothetical protein